MSEAPEYAWMFVDEDGDLLGYPEGRSDLFKYRRADLVDAEIERLRRERDAAQASAAHWATRCIAEMQDNDTQEEIIRELSGWVHRGGLSGAQLREILERGGMALVRNKEAREGDAG